MELGVVNKIGVPGYFLIVQEYINWAKNNGIRVGCGRGCFTPNQLVGRKRIENVEIGSKVRTFNGQMQKVTNKFSYDVDEDMIKELIKINGFYRAYHMNKKSWISVILDDTLDNEIIYSLIDQSYNNVNK